MEPTETVDLRPVDWALIVEALVMWAGDPNAIERAREERAYELVESIADALGLAPDDLVASLDTDLDGDDL